MTKCPICDKDLPESKIETHIIKNHSKSHPKWVQSHLQQKKACMHFTLDVLAETIYNCFKKELAPEFNVTSIKEVIYRWSDEHLKALLEGSKVVKE